MADENVKDLFESGEDVTDLFEAGEDVASDDSTVSDTLEDVASAGAQGLTMGFSDELAGAVRGGAAKIAGNETDLTDLYAKYRDIERERYKQAQERSPVLSTVAEIGGAIAPSLVTGGGTLLTGGAKALAQTGLREALKQGGKKQLAKVAGAKLGELALQGAVQGVGQSETLAEAPKQAYETAKSSVAYGAPLGMVGEFAFKGSNAASKAAGDIGEDSQFFRQLKRSFEKGKEGTVIGSGRQAATRMAQESVDDVSDVTRRILQADSQFGQEIGNRIKDATVKGIKVSVDETLDDAAKSLSSILEQDPNLLGRLETNKLTKELFDLQNSQLTPEAAYQLRSRVLDLANTIKDPRLENVARRFGQGVKKTLESQVEGLEAASNQFKRFREAIPETIVSDGIPQEFSSKWFGDLKDGETKLYKGVEELIGGLNVPGEKQIKARKTFAELIENVKKMDEQHPGFIKQLGFKNLSELTNSIETKADEAGIRRMILGYEPQAGFKREAAALLTGDAGSTLRGRAYGLANLAGRTSKAVTEATPDAVANTAKFTKKVFDLPDNTLREVATRMQQDPRLSRYGANLINALDNKGSIGRNAVLFSMMQNPETRNAMRDFDFGLDENDEDNQ